MVAGEKEYSGEFWPDNLLLSLFLSRGELNREGSAATFHPEYAGRRLLQNQLHLLRHCLRLLPWKSKQKPAKGPLLAYYWHLFKQAQQSKTKTHDFIEQQR
jgi:hypothetical protein